MRYLADILTLIRFILATALLLIAIFDTNANIGVGFLLFAGAELTDAFDGVCAARWPFPKNKTPKYRKYAVQYDMYADALTALAGILFFTLRVNFAVGLSVTLIYGAAALIIDIIVYGRLFGHPDDCTPQSLARRNFPLAKKIVLIRRMVYIFLIATMTFWLLFASPWPLGVRISIAVAVFTTGTFLWFFLSQRRHNISRDAVDLERQRSSRHSRKTK